MNKMKSFWKILIQKMAFGLLGGIIVCLVLSSIAYMFFTEYEDNYFSDVFEKEKERVSESAKEAPISELNDKISFRFAVDAETKNGINYIWMEDEETGKIVANSNRGVFIILKDRKTEETSKIYRVDSKYLQPVNKYDNINIFDRFYYFWGGELMYLPTLVPEFYTFRALNAYRGDGEAYPGTIEVLGSAEAFTDEETVVETVTLAPENADDYEFVEKENDYTIILIGVGNSYAPQIDGYAKEVMDKPFADGEDSVSTTTYDGFFWPGRGAFFGKFRYTDSADKSYIVHYSGEFYFRELAVYVIGANLLIMIVAAVIALISAKKQYNREKYQYSLVAYQNNLIDVMAHDLRTPLMAMSGYAENLKEEANSDKRDYYIDAILKNTDHMSQIISRNLELTKISTERIKKNYKKIDIVEMLKDSLDGYKPIFEERKIAINIEGSLEINGDEEQMKTAIDNLASNMVKYVNDGGSIDIAVTKKVLSISNTTAEKVKNASKLWEPFVRGDESRSNQGGTGLGLAIAKGIFDRHKLKSKIRFANGRFIIELKK